jgi:hypothetical protein
MVDLLVLNSLDHIHFISKISFTLFTKQASYVLEVNCTLSLPLTKYSRVENLDLLVEMSDLIT